MSEVVEAIGHHRAIAIVRTDSAEQAETLARAAYDGGMRILEITLTVPDAPKVIAKLSADMADAIIGAGTVLDVQSARAAIKGGARFIVAPNVDPEVIAAAKAGRACVCPGAATPTEAAHAHQLGAELVKIFPASLLGGPTFISTLLQPMPDLRLVPSGGIDPDNVVGYLRAGAFAVGLGGSLFYRGIDTAGDVLAITARARALLDRIQHSTI